MLWGGCLPISLGLRPRSTLSSQRHARCCVLIAKLTLSGLSKTEPGLPAYLMPFFSRNPAGNQWELND